MEPFLKTHIAQSYKSLPQKIRVLTEDWVGSQVFCPNCGNMLRPFKNNRPVADFCCTNCNEEYELKSKRNGFGLKIVDGAYASMMERLQSAHNPNFFLLTYTPAEYQIIDFAVIPKHFIIPRMIEKRKALSPTARRAGWIGCNILLRHIPESGKIYYIRDRKIFPKENVLQNWSKTLFLRETKQPEVKGWILEVINCIDQLDNREFSLRELYAFEPALKEKYPQNHHIKDKIRQQLQILRNKNYLRFLGNGKYQRN